MVFAFSRSKARQSGFGLLGRHIDPRALDLQSAGPDWKVGYGKRSK